MNAKTFSAELTAKVQEFLGTDFATFRQEVKGWIADQLGGAGEDYNLSEILVLYYPKIRPDAAYVSIRAIVPWRQDAVPWLEELNETSWHIRKA
jgi:hypothetical protein